MATKEALQASSIVAQLKKCGITHVMNLPDTESRFMYDAFAVEPDITLVPVAREGEAMAIAAGLYMANKRPAVQIQNTGFFESGDSIRGICLATEMPLLMIIGYRGYVAGGETPRDSAALFLEPMLRTWGIPYQVVSQEAEVGRISESYELAERLKCTVAVLVTPQENE